MAEPARSSKGKFRVIAGSATGETFDPLSHERMRLSILSALAVNEALTFADLKQLLGASDGNLSVHARKLEDAAYISCSKSFSGRLPKTDYKLTAKGRGALEGVQRLDGTIGRHAARNLAGGVAPHAVGDDVDTEFFRNRVGVLVGTTAKADIGADRRTQGFQFRLQFTDSSDGVHPPDPARRGRGSTPANPSEGSAPRLMRCSLKAESFQAAIQREQPRVLSMLLQAPTRKAFNFGGVRADNTSRRDLGGAVTLFQLVS